MVNCLEVNLWNETRREDEGVSVVSVSEQYWRRLGADSLLATCECWTRSYLTEQNFDIFDSCNKYCNRTHHFFLNQSNRLFSLPLNYEVRIMATWLFLFAYFTLNLLSIPSTILSFVKLQIEIISLIFLAVWFLLSKPIVWNLNRRTSLMKIF